MSKLSSYLLVAVLGFSLCFVVMSCANLDPLEIESSVDAESANHLLSEFPLTQGTMWVYTYTPYEPLPTNPTQIVTATYRLTETVVATEVSAPYLFVRVRRDISLASTTPLTSANLPEGEFVYVISGTQVYQASGVVEYESFDPDYASLMYDFPLVAGKHWCPIRFDLKNPDSPEVVHCEANGLRTVAVAGIYETPAGSFEDCYSITEAYNSGGVMRWFCNGVGVVAARYDHAGTRFGFEQLLIDHLPAP